MRRVLVLVLVTMMLMMFYGCEEEETGIALSEYSERYESITKKYENFMAEEMNISYFHMIDVLRFRRDYSNENIKQDLIDVVTYLEEMQLELGTLGMDLKKDDILEMQSEIELAVDEMIQIYKEAKENRTFTTVQASQFTLYSEMHKLLDRLSGPMQKYYENHTMITEHLKNADVSLSVELTSQSLQNRLRFDYFYLVFSTQIATYQDYTGLLVNPNRTEFVKHDGKYHRVSELDPTIMNTLKEFLEKEITQLNEISMMQEIAFESYNEMFQGIIDTYNIYFGLRSQLPADFFVSGAFKDYQALGEYPYNFRPFMLIMDLEPYYLENTTNIFYHYDFDAYPEMQFDIMDEAYLSLQRNLFNVERKNILFYDDLELEPVVFFDEVFE